MQTHGVPTLLEVNDLWCMRHVSSWSTANCQLIQDLLTSDLDMCTENKKLFILKKKNPMTSFIIIPCMIHHMEALLDVYKYLRYEKCISSEQQLYRVVNNNAYYLWVKARFVKCIQKYRYPTETLILKWSRRGEWMLMDTKLTSNISICTSVSNMKALRLPRQTWEVGVGKILKWLPFFKIKAIFTKYLMCIY